MGFGEGSQNIFTSCKNGGNGASQPKFFFLDLQQTTMASLQTRHTHYVFPAAFLEKKVVRKSFFPEKKGGKRLWVRTFLVPCLCLSSSTVQCQTRRKTFLPSKVLSKTHFPIFLFGENVRNQWAALTLTPFLRSHGWALKAFIRGWREGITKSSFLPPPSCPHFAQRQQKGIEGFLSSLKRWIECLDPKHE